MVRKANPVIKKIIIIVTSGTIFMKKDELLIFNYTNNIARYYL